MALAHLLNNASSGKYLASVLPAELRFFILNHLDLRPLLKLLLTARI